MAVRVEQCTDRDPGNVFVGRRRVAAPTRRPRQHPELGGNRQNQQIVVGEEPGINRDVRGVGQQCKQLVGQPVMAGHQRRMLGAGQPLAQSHDRLHTRAARSHGKGDRAIESMGWYGGLKNSRSTPSIAA